MATKKNKQDTSVRLDVPVVAPVAARPRRKVMDAQVAGAMAMADELARASSYVADFGSHTPDRDQLASHLRSAHEWSLEQARADAWQSHVTRQRVTAWDLVLGELAQLQPVFDQVVANDPSVAARFPATAAFLAARRGAAQRALATKVKDRKGQKPEGKSTGATAPQANEGNGGQ